MLTVTVAMAAAIAFGWSTALMHQGASEAPAEASGLLQLLGYVVRQWRWLLGMAASLAGLGLHAAALHLGSIAVVQPLVVTGLVFSFLFRSMLDRTLPSRQVLALVLLTAVGLTVFLLAADAPSSDRGIALPGALAVLTVGAVLVATGCIAAARHPAHAGVLLGSASGVVFGLIAGTLKATTDAASNGVLAMLTAWPTYVLAVLGVSGFLLNQRAYQRAPLSRSLPASNTINPVVALVYGAVAFHERLNGDPGALVAETLGLAAVLVGVFLLARTEEVAVA